MKAEVVSGLPGKSRPLMIIKDVARQWGIKGASKAPGFYGGMALVRFL